MSGCELRNDCFLTVFWLFAYGFSDCFLTVFLPFSYSLLTVFLTVFWLFSYRFLTVFLTVFWLFSCKWTVSSFFCRLLNGRIFVCSCVNRYFYVFLFTCHLDTGQHAFATLVTTILSRRSKKKKIENRRPVEAGTRSKSPFFTSVCRFSTKKRLFTCFK